jgi:hypothetical protein
MNKDKPSSPKPSITIDLPDLLDYSGHEDTKAAAPSPQPKVGERSYITNVTRDSGSSGAGQVPAGQPGSSAASSGETSGTATSQSGGNTQKTNDGGTG